MKRKIIAAGGLIVNEKNELLMIFRRNKWDLPKGKLDEGESIESCALREVREETGLSPVLTGKMAGITYHDYFDKWSKEDVTKETHWYGMKADGTQQLVPQTEEDITEIKWVPEKEVAKYLKESYPSIVEIITKWRKEGE
jgi:8-oxo-dGTP pyrophosphatase MutT (NUDIX family)